MNQKPKKEFIDAKEVASMLGVSKQTILHWVRPTEDDTEVSPNERFPKPYRFGPRCLRRDQAQIEKFILYSGVAEFSGEVTPEDFENQEADRDYVES